MYAHIAALVSCDDMRRIRYLNVGWPGSVHDQRIFLNSKLTINAPNMYSPQEYLLGDSAFTPTSFLVPAYKKYGGKVQLTAGQKFFNDLVSSARCQVEHTIGIWKGRFPFLRELRLRIRGKRADVNQIGEGVCRASQSTGKATYSATNMVFKDG